MVPVAAFVFAVVAWIATCVLAYGSESAGIAGATVAMFPTGFGVAGVIVRKVELAGQRPRIGRLLAVAFAGGALAVVLFAFFMAAIWPSL